LAAPALMGVESLREEGGEGEAAHRNRLNETGRASLRSAAEA
jgi:hypothetical protein